MGPERGIGAGEGERVQVESRGFLLGEAKELVKFVVLAKCSVYCICED